MFYSSLFGGEREKNIINYKTSGNESCGYACLLAMLVSIMSRFSIASCFRF